MKICPNLDSNLAHWPYAPMIYHRVPGKYPAYHFSLVFVVKAASAAHDGRFSWDTKSVPKTKENPTLIKSNIHIYNLEIFVENFTLLYLDDITVENFKFLKYRPVKFYTKFPNYIHVYYISSRLVSLSFRVCTRVVCSWKYFIVCCGCSLANT